MSSVPSEPSPGEEGFPPRVHSASSEAAEAYAAASSLAPEPDSGPQVDLPGVVPGAEPAIPLGEASGAAEAPPAAEPNPLDVLAATEAERDEYLDALRRLQADFENFRKRTQRQQAEQVERAAENLIAGLLPALDAFDLARAHLGDQEANSPEGRALLQASALLADTLSKEGLERVEDTGSPFDPTTHEAVEHAEGSDAEGPVVDEVLRVGYRWKGRVLRPAMVRVRG
jgi:molecular chaperone GrpE